MTETSIPNRRQFQRYAVTDSVFLAFRPRFDRLGMLKDISKGGVAFDYTVSDTPQPLENSNIEVEVFSHKTFRLSRIPCRIVYDTRVKAGLSMVGFETRRCGLEFGQLSELQAAQLKVLMDTHIGDGIPEM
jgi:hypothetical protein